MSHHEYHDDHYDEDCHEHSSFEAPLRNLRHFGPGNKRKSKLVRYALVALAVVVLFVIGLIVGLVILFIHFLSVPSMGILEALTEAWQSVLDWFKPIANLYDQTMKLIPGGQE